LLFEKGRQSLRRGHVAILVLRRSDIAFSKPKNALIVKIGRK
jgi:hypothetical protein